MEALVDDLRAREILYELLAESIGATTGTEPEAAISGSGEASHAEPLSGPPPALKSQPSRRHGHARRKDPPEFVAQVEAEARRRLGGTIDQVVPGPELREVAYNAIARSLRETPAPVPAHFAELFKRLAEHGIQVTPGTGDPRDLPRPIFARGVSLSEAVLEERYGLD